MSGSALGPLTEPWVPRRRASSSCGSYSEMTPRANTAGLRLAATVVAATITNAAAGPVPCAKAHSPEQRAAVAAADAWHAQYWQRANGLWSAAYQLPPAPTLPLGIGIFKRAGAFADVIAAAAANPIQGVATVAALVCTTYEVTSDHTFVVRYVGRKLSFNEDAQGWSRPLPEALLHVLEVRTEGADTGVIPLITARTALPPDAQLSRPPPSDTAQTLPAKRRR